MGPVKAVLVCAQSQGTPRLHPRLPVQATCSWLQALLGRPRTCVRRLIAGLRPPHCCAPRVTAPRRCRDEWALRRHAAKALADAPAAMRFRRGPQITLGAPSEACAAAARAERPPTLRFVGRGIFARSHQLAELSRESASVASPEAAEQGYVASGLPFGKSGRPVTSGGRSCQGAQTARPPLASKGQGALPLHPATSVACWLPCEMCERRLCLPRGVRATACRARATTWAPLPRPWRPSGPTASLPSNAPAPAPP